MGKSEKIRAIQKFFSANGAIIRSAEGALVIGFAIAIWESGGDMTIAIPVIVLGVLASALIIATAPNLTRAIKIAAAIGLTFFFIVEGYCVFWHYHPQDASGVASNIIGFIGGFNVLGWLLLIMAACLVALFVYVRRNIQSRVASAPHIDGAINLDVAHLLDFAVNGATIAWLDALIAEAPNGQIPRSGDTDQQADAYEAHIKFVRRVVSATTDTFRGLDVGEILHTAEANAEHQLDIFLKDSPEKQSDFSRLRRFYVVEAQCGALAPFLKREREEVIRKIIIARSNLIERVRLREKR